MTRSTRTISLLLALGMVSSLAGCATWSQKQQNMLTFYNPHAYGETMTQSPHEHYQQVSEVSATDARLLVEDLDLLFLTERPTRLMRWNSK